MSHIKIRTSVRVISIWGVLLPFIFLTGCAVHGNASDIESCHSDGNNPALAWISKDDYEEVQNFRDFPKDVQTSFNVQMAEPNQEFNSSDDMVAGLPTQRFITGGLSKDFAFIYYEQGGFAYSRRFVVLKRNDAKADIFFYGYFSERVSSLEQLKAAIEEGKIIEFKN